MQAFAVHVERKVPRRNTSVLVDAYHAARRVPRQQVSVLFDVIGADPPGPGLGEGDCELAQSLAVAQSR